MRVLFCGGGTAGHVYPNIAISETILKNDPNSKIAYAVTANGIENDIVPFKKYKIDAIGFKRSLSFKNLYFFKSLIQSIKQSKEIISEFRPDVIVGTGGYATYPVVYAGSKMGIKTVLHESNVIPGKAILKLEKRADKILINFEETKEYFKHKEKIVKVGNPLRQSCSNTNKENTKARYNIKNQLVVTCFGGSLGATRINEAVIELIDNLLKHRRDIVLFWATGKKEYEKIRSILRKKMLDRLNNVKIFDYITNMPEIIAISDIVVSRAGSMTISELALAGKCTIIVPSPNVTNNHQYKNAKLLADNDATNLITESELNILTDRVKELLFDEKKREKYEKKIKKFADFDANKKFYLELMKTIEL